MASGGRRKSRFWFGWLVTLVALAVAAWFAFVPFNVQVLGTTVPCGHALANPYIGGGDVPTTLSGCAAEANQRLGIAVTIGLVGCVALAVTLLLSFIHGAAGILGRRLARRRVA